MAKQSLPADLAGIIEPLREADEYTRLQHIRQRGFYNLITGLPMFFFLLPFIPLLPIGLDASVGSPAFVVYLVQVALHWGLFGISCYPQLFMPLVRRHRPDWQSPLIEASLLKRALEKHFWAQFLFTVLFVMLISMTIAFDEEFGATDGLDDAIKNGHAGWVGATVLVLACVILAWQARRLHDGWLQWAFLAMLPLAAIVVFVNPLELGRETFSLAIIAPPLVIGLVRLFGPRRWLVR